MLRLLIQARLRGLLAGSGVLLLLFLPFGSFLGPPGTVSHVHLPALARGAEGATPDCGPPEVDLFAVRQRTLHLARLGVTAWHDRGHRGQGVKVAILDSGFRGYRDHLGKALPHRVQTRSFRLDGNLEAKDSQHGILCGEVLHALAPQADLLLANWEPDCPEKFLEAVRWARQQGARIISCSVIMPSWSDAEGGGPVHEALTRVIGSGQGLGDMLCFASAGNTARRHWCGRFVNRDGKHEWKPGQTENGLIPWSEERVSIELCSPSTTTYRLEVRDSTTGAEVIPLREAGTGTAGCTVFRFLPRSDHRYRVRVHLLQGPPSFFHLVVLGGELQHATANGSIPFPGDGPEVLAVGAVDREGKRQSYSSCGPNSRQPKPDFVSPVPFASLWRARAFAGTSAAAPQAAGVAALWWSRYPAWTAAQVRDTIRQTARDLGQPGHDPETGHGQVQMPLDPGSRPTSHTVRFR